MWTFDFAVDYTMIDRRVITHQHQVTIDEPGLEDEQMAWNWVQDTFLYEDFDYLAVTHVRLLHTEWSYNAC